MSRVGYRLSTDFATSHNGDFTVVVSSSVCDGVSICGSSGNFFGGSSNGCAGSRLHTARYRSQSTHRHGRFSPECGLDDDE